MSEDQLVEKWLLDKSETSKPIYLRVLNRYLEYRGMTARELIQEAIEDRKHDFLDQGIPELHLGKYVEHLRRSKARDKYGRRLDSYLSENSISQAIAIIKSFYSKYRVVLDFKIKKANPMVRKKTLSAKEVDQIILSLKHIRDKALTVFLFQSGMRIGDALNLRYKDIKEDFEAERIPMKINAMSRKTNHQYFTFIGKDGFNLLSLYLKDRDLNDDALLFVTVNGNPHDPSQYERYFKEALLKCGLIEESKNKYQHSEITPHSLRSSFSTILTSKMDSRYIEYFLGHQDQYNGAYFKPSLDELREIYGDAMSALELREDIEPIKKEMDKIKMDFYEAHKEKEQLKEEIERLRIAQRELNEMIIELGERTINVDEDPVNRDWIAELRKKTEV